METYIRLRLPEHVSFTGTVKCSQVLVSLGCLNVAHLSLSNYLSKSLPFHYAFVYMLFINIDNSFIQSYFKSVYARVSAKEDSQEIPVYLNKLINLCRNSSLAVQSPSFV